MSTDREPILNQINTLAHEKSIPLDVVASTVALVACVAEPMHVSMAQAPDPWSYTIQIHRPLGNIISCVVSRFWIAAEPRGILFTVWISGSTISPARKACAYRTLAEAVDVILQLEHEGDVEK